MSESFRDGVPLQEASSGDTKAVREFLTGVSRNTGRGRFGYVWTLQCRCLVSLPPFVILGSASRAGRVLRCRVTRSGLEDSRKLWGLSAACFLGTGLSCFSGDFPNGEDT